MERSKEEILNDLIPDEQVNFAAHNRFQRGSGCYQCSMCGKMTRDTGHDESGTSSGLCKKCYRECSRENHHNDMGHDPNIDPAECPQCAADGLDEDWVNGLKD